MIETTVCEVVQQAGKVVALCPVEHETLAALLTDPNHWVLELVIMAVFDGLIGLLAWPFVKAWWGRHHSHEQCDPAH